MKTFHIKAMVASVLFLLCCCLTATAQIDMTNKITNPSFEDGWTGWTQSNMQRQSNNVFTLKAGNYYVEKWVSNGNAAGNGGVWQTISNLPVGVYTISAKAQNVQENDKETAQTGVFLTANGDNTAINFAGEYSVSTVCADGNLKIGFVMEGATGNYVCVDDFHLTKEEITSESPLLPELQEYMNYIEGNYNNMREADQAAAKNYIETLRSMISSNSFEGFEEAWNSLISIADKYIFNIIAEESLPIVIVNDTIEPWRVIGNEVYSAKTPAVDYGTSELTATFTIDKPCILSWNERMTYNTSYHQIYVYIDGTLYHNRYFEGTRGAAVCLAPGDHTIVWQDWVRYGFYNQYKTYLSDVKLTDQLNENVDVTISAPGQLGYEALKAMNDDSKYLRDIQYLKVHGTMNEKDWQELGDMTGLYGLDLTDAQFENIPANAFNKILSLSYLLLPEGVKTIGNQAFMNTQLLNLDVPSSVISIGDEAFRDVRIQHINFKEDSQLKTIGYQAFYNCYSLLEFNMPNTVTTMRLHNNSTNYDNYDSNAFRECVRMKSLVLSESLTYVPRYACYGCTALQTVVLPKNCTVVYHYAFCNNTSLKSITFNDKLQTLKEYAFNTVSNLHKLTLPESLRRIEGGVFSGSGIDSLIIPIKTNEILGGFGNCVNLVYVELPSLSKYSNHLFSGSKNIKTIICKSATPPVMNYDLFNDNGPVKSSITIYVPKFAVPDYKLDSYWSQFGEIKSLDMPLDYWRISGNLILGNNSRMDGKPDVDVFYGGKLTVTGNDPMPVKNLKLCVSESNPGVLLNNCGQFTADSIVSVFSVAKNTWYFITPMFNVKKSEVKHSNASADFIFRYYNSENRAANGTTSNRSWQNVVGDTLYAGQGYIYQCNQDGEIIMPAIKETQANVFTVAEVTKSLKAYFAENAANANWNYVGNPYPCNYDIWYMDFTAPITIRNGSNYEAKTITDDNYVLRPMQAFFVQKPNDVDKIVFRHEGRVTASSVNHPHASDAPARTAKEKERYLFNLEISDGEQTDQTRVVFNNAAKMDYELERDASKFMSDEPTMPQIYSFDLEGNRLAINERPEQDGKVSLGVHIGKYGTYTISATRADADITLYDSMTGETINLTKDSYTFTSDAANYNDRFFLNASGTTGISSAEAEADGSWPMADGLFNLNGQKVSDSYKGIVIKDGHKVIKLNKR